MREFKGIYPAIVTPCGVAGGFDEAAMRRIVRHQLAAGVHGFYVCGGTGEGHRFPAISRPWTRTASLTGTAVRHRSSVMADQLNRSHSCLLA